MELLLNLVDVLHGRRILPSLQTFKKHNCCPCWQPHCPSEALHPQYPFTAAVNPMLSRLDEMLVQGTHDQVPPDVLEPVLRQLVDQFIHDRARPAVMTVGIKTVRELCTRSPLIMTPELLQVKPPCFHAQSCISDPDAVGAFRQPRLVCPSDFVFSQVGTMVEQLPRSNGNS